jgi:sulfoacetaldehyde dehydrogenase
MSPMNLQTAPDGPQAGHAPIAAQIARARAAMATLKVASQARIDEAVVAIAWAIYKPERARELAELAVAGTGLGNVPDKITKNTRKTFGALRDLLRARTVGIIEEDPAKGLVKYAKPVGVVAAICPSTNPAATPANKAMMSLKGGNAVIVAPSPAGYATAARFVELARVELQKANFDPDLIQVLVAPVDKAATSALMNMADLVVVTGSQNNVRRAYSSGTPAIGVGAGNVPVIIDETADLDAAADMIMRSKIFDNATSCSSENSVILLDQVYDDALAALGRAGGYLATGDARQRVLDTLWQNGHLNRHILAKDMPVLADVFRLGDRAAKAKFLMVEESGIGDDYPLSGEKLSLVLTVYRARDFAHAKQLVHDILAHEGMGHSCGIHTALPERARALAEDLDVVRVLVNQAHTFGNGGSFDNGLPFTLSMGCGTWAGNSITENLNYRHFINITHLVTTIPEDKPSEEALFGGYWAKYGK